MYIYVRRVNVYVCGQGVCVPMSNDCQRGVQEDPVILEDVDMSTYGEKYG